MPQFEIVLKLTSLGDDAERAAEAFAEELLAEAREHLLDHERIELASVRPVARTSANA